jgi:hypothetical protein
MRHIKSALALGLRPSAHILALKKPLSGWSEWDHKLAVAFSQLEAEICEKCGNPIWICRTTDDRVQFTVEKYRCFADAELEKKRNKRTKEKRELKPGEYEYTRAETIDGGPLPSREDYYKRISEHLNN